MMNKCTTETYNGIVLYARNVEFCVLYIEVGKHKIVELMLLSV